MYPKRSHILPPLTKMSSPKGAIPWSPECQTVFDQMKALLVKEAFLQYPDHNQPFHIYTDASDLQLSAAIFQNDKPVAFYSGRLTPAQQNYTVGEKELLSIIGTLKEFRTMLYGCSNIHVYTNHQNNTFQCFQTQRVLCWHLFLEDYGVQFHYIKGETNYLADMLSRLPFVEEQMLPSESSRLASSTSFAHLHCTQANNHKTSSDQSLNLLTQNYYSMAINDDNLLDCFANLPSTEGIPFVLG